MHDTAYEIGRKFFEIYVKASSSTTIVEIGAFDVNGALRDFCPHAAHYLGLDFDHGPGVDIVIRSNEPLPLRSQFADIVISSSQMEHDPFFWKTFLELLRILKSDGLLYLNVPSNGSFHRYPTDCWRFYPDAGKVLEAWGRENGHKLVLVESFLAERNTDQWNDFVAVFQKTDDIVDTDRAFLWELIASVNVRSWKTDEIQRMRVSSEDMTIIDRLTTELSSAREEISKLSAEIARLEERLTEERAVKERTSGD